MAKCKSCEKDALEGCDYCASCRELRNHGWKTFWKGLGTVCIVVGGIVGTILRVKKSGTSQT